MPIVTILQAKTDLSNLVDRLVCGPETEIIIARYGRPPARLVALKPAGTGRRIGIAKGKHVVPDNIDADNDLIAALFGGKDA